MSVLNPNAAFLKSVLGPAVEKSTGTLAATTVPLFTVAGGLVAVTSIVGDVTTAITVANSYKLQHNPTAGNTVDIVTATDIGTTDSPAGTVLGFKGSDSSIIGIGAAGSDAAQGLTSPLILSEGQIESVSAGTDGVINWIVTWVPLQDGATLVAA
jgi:hypothetical protein